MPNISFRNTSGIKMHYVSFNFGRDLGELHSLLNVFLNLILRGTCPRFNSRCPLQIVSLTRSYGRRDFI